jgi:hypothetical protein
MKASEIRTLRLVRPSRRRVVGRVVDPEGVGIVASLTLSSGDQANATEARPLYFCSGTCDADGHFDFPAPGDRKLAVFVHANGYSPLRVEMSETQTEIEITLQPQEP